MRAASGIAFEILVKNRQEERLALAYAQSLGRIGVAATVRLNDEVQFQRRRTKFDFDMMIGSWVATPSPGGEQRTRWGSASANMDGAYNIAGAASPAIDAMIAALLAARQPRGFRRRRARAGPRADFGLLYRAVVLRARAMDRLFGAARPSRKNAAFRRQYGYVVEQEPVKSDGRPID